MHAHVHTHTTQSFQAVIHVSQTPTYCLLTVFPVPYSVVSIGHHNSQKREISQNAAASSRVTHTVCDTWATT